MNMKTNYKKIALMCLALVPAEVVLAGSLTDLSGQVEGEQTLVQEQPTIRPLLAKDSLWGFSSAGREMIDVITSQGEVIKAVDVDGIAYVGDIILGDTIALKKHGLRVGGKSEVKKAVQAQTFGASAAIIYPSTGNKWPGGVVPYVIANNLGPQAKQDLNYGINHWNNNTNVKLEPRPNQTNYVVVQGANSCSSALGMQGGAQTLNLAEGCGIHGAIHEFGHALGFSHEHTRTDRDSYVQILWDNMDPNMAYNFYTLDTNYNTNHGTYDYQSIMHYPTHGFSINGGATLWPLNPNVIPENLGHSNGLSQGDIAATAALYGNSGQTFYGYLSGTNAYAIQPNGEYFEWAGGQLTGTLVGPQNADFDLSLHMWDNGWVEIDSSASYSSNERISGSAPAGCYYFKISSYNGSGDYRLTIE